MNTSTPPSTPLVAFILDALAARGWSQRRLVEAANLSPGALSRVLRGMVTPETATVEKIVDALGVLRLDLLKLLAAEPANLVAAPQRDVAP